MNPVDYCEQKAAPPGSSIYYALRFAKPAARRAQVALYAFRRELSDTVLHVSDSSVAQTKLAWWHKEVVTAAGAPAAHPILQALQSAAPDLIARPQPLLDLVAGFNADLMQARYLDYPGLHRHFQTVSGRFAGLIACCACCACCAYRASRDAGAWTAAARAAAASASAASASAAASAAVSSADGTLPGMAAAAHAEMSCGANDWTSRLGVGLSLAGMIAEVGADARRGRIYIPISEMQQFGVTAADILARRYSDNFSELMRFQTIRARGELQGALRVIPPEAGRRQGVLRAQAAMAVRLLDEIANAQFQVLHQHIALTPIRNLVTSWWAVRRPARG